MSDEPPIEEVVNAWAKQLLERDMEQMKVGFPAAIPDEILEDMVVRPLRPNVTPVTPPAIGAAGIVLAVLAMVPWWIGVWQIVRWIWR